MLLFNQSQWVTWDGCPGEGMRCAFKGSVAAWFVLYLDTAIIRFILQVPRGQLVGGAVFAPRNAGELDVKRRLIISALTLCLFSLNASAAVWYVDRNNPGSEDGLSWATAYKTIQPALDAASSGDEVWVAAGTYDELRTASATGSLQMKAGVALYGGFDGTETARSERKYKTNITIIDGINGRGVLTRAYNVVRGANNAVLNGFIVQNGRANGTTLLTKRGAGMNNDGVSSLTVQYCTFRSNDADGVGGGMHNLNASVTVDACIFHGNTSSGLGETDGTGGGGGMANCNGGTVTVTNCLFYSNSASGDEASGGGGLLSVLSSSSIIRNCTFSLNTAAARTLGGEGGGGAIFVSTSGSATVSNCIAWGDTSTEIDKSTLLGGTLTVSNSIVQGGFTGGTGIIVADPLFVSPGTNDFRIQGTSPARNAGTAVGAPDFDLLGTARPQEGTDDIGAYEYDATAPTANCLNNLKFLDSNGEAAITAAEVNDGSSDAGGIESLSIDTDLLECDDLPSAPVTLTVTDFAGNTATCIATITLSDPIDPVIDFCANNINVPVDSNCNAIVPDFTTLTIASDNCTIASKTQSPLAGTVISDPTEVVITVTDSSGLTAQCSAFAIPTDLSGPSITTCPADRTLFANASCEVTVPNLVPEAVATDGCGGAVTITQSPAAGSIISATTIVTITAEDVATNQTTCQVILTVQDNIDPTFPVCPPAQTLAADSNCEGVVPNLVALATADDNCGVATVVQSPLAGATIVAPLTVVTLTATDTSGNTGTCTVDVTLEDQTDPQILACASDQTVPIGAGCAATVPDLLPGVIADDNCGTPTLSQSPTAGTSISGDTLVTITATDSSGNTDTCTATVFIDDTTPPTITDCADNTTVDLDGACEALVPDLTTQVTATDNCGIQGVTQLPLAGTTITSATVVTLTVTDTAGNTSTCNATVSVQDVTGPQITTCAPDQNVALNVSCQAVLPDFTAGVVANDPCSPPVTVTQSPLAGTVISGLTTVTLTVTDNAGNSSTCTAQAIATDGGAPVITFCPGDETLDLNANCQVAVPDYASAVTATDDCTITVTQDPPAGTLVAVDTVVDITVEDTGGLQDTCSLTITVQDVTGPVITRTGPSIVTVPLNGTYTEQGATAIDNCDGVRPVTIGGGPVVTTAPNTYNLTYSASDTQGNPGTPATRTVIVTNDSTPPDITLLGTNPANVNCGQGYTDPGATATDNIDGNITANIIVTGGPIVATSPPGQYTLTYTVTDSGGNTATRNRTVNVLDNCPLTVTVVGSLLVERAVGDAVTLEVTVTGAIGTPQVQWEFETAPNVWAPILGENGLTLTIPVIDAADFGRYRASATDDVSPGVVSQAITLRDVNAIPAMGLLGLGALAAATALGGAMGLRRRNK